VQSGVGFGFALVAAPVLVTVYAPDRSVPTIAVLGLLVSGLTLGFERRRPRVLRPVADRLILASVPGMAAGAVVLARAPDDLLRVLVALSVFAAVAVQAQARRSDATPGAGGDMAAGLVSGALATTTGLNGPPLVVRLLQHGASAQEMRDTLAVVFVAASLLMIAVLTVGGALDPVPALPLLAATTIAGQIAGRRLFARIHRHHREATLVVLSLTALAALAPVARAIAGG
jgi:uncharacterized membrane protein YfcA